MSRPPGRYLPAILLALAPALVLAQSQRELFVAVTPKTFDSGGAVSRQFHRHAESYLRSTTIARGGPVRTLQENLRSDLAAVSVADGDRHLPFAGYVAEDGLLDSVIVLHKGNIVFESYPNMQPWQRHYAWSVTKVLMLLIETVTGQSYADAVRRRIWERIGAEDDALMTISAEGYAYASGGLSAKLHDLFRFGLVFTESERFPDIARSMIADIRSGGGIALAEEPLAALSQEQGSAAPVRAGWQWDQIWDDGGMYKGGYLGQGLYVDPGRGLVIAWFGTGLDYSQKVTAMESVARQLAVSGLFAAGR